MSPQSQLRGRWIAGALLAAAGLTAWLLWSPGQSPLPVAMPESLTEPPAGAGASLAAPDTAAEELQRQLVAAIRFPAEQVALPAAGGSDPVRITIVDAATGTAVPRAVVHAVIDLDGSRWTAAQREEALALLTDRERLIERYGQRHTADEAGKVTLPRPRQGGAICARHGDKYGELFLGADPLDPLYLELASDHSVPIRVYQANGAAANGIEVTLQGRFGDQHHEQTIEVGTTDAQGKLTIRHLHQLLAPNVTQFGPVREIYAAAKIAGGLPPRVRLDPLGQAPVELHLPPTASLVVRFVDSRGNPYAKPARVDVGVGGDDGLVREQVGVNLTMRDRGIARFPYVRLATRLTVIAQIGGFGCRPIETDTPAEAGATQTLDIPIPATRPVLLLGLRDATGAPVAHGSFWCVPLTEKDSIARRAEATDEFGRMVLMLPPTAIGAKVDTLVLIEQRDLQPSGRVAKLPLGFALTAGELDIGQGVLSDAPVLAAGQVVDQDGRGVNANLQLERLTAAVPKETWTNVPEVLPWQAEDGAFRFHGLSTGAPLRLRASLAGFLPAEPVPLVPGQRDLRLVLVRGGTLHLRCLLPDDVPLAQVDCVLRSDTPDSPPPLSRNLRRTRTGQADTTFGPLRAGSYQLRINLRSDPEPLATIDGLAVAGGAATKDPRLLPLDLRSRLHVLTVRLLAPDGTLVKTERGGVFVRQAKNDRPLEGYPAPAGEARIVQPRPTADLLVDVPGYRPEELLQASGTVEVRLRAGLEVELVATAKLADDERLELGLVWAGPPAGFEYRLNTPSVFVRPDPVPPSRRAAGVARDGTAVVTVGAPGRYRVTARALLPKGQSRALAVTPAEIEVTDAAGTRPRVECAVQ